MKRLLTSVPIVLLLGACGTGNALYEEDAAAATASTLPPTTTSTAPPTTMVPTTTTTMVPTTTTTMVRRPTTTAPRASRGASRTPVGSSCSASRAAAHECWDYLINRYSWNTTKAFNIMWCESHGNPNAKNARSTATGLFQILGGPLDPEANVRQAFAMYSKRGWQPWVCQ